MPAIAAVSKSTNLDVNDGCISPTPISRCNATKAYEIEHFSDPNRVEKSFLDIDFPNLNDIVS